MARLGHRWSEPGLAAHDTHMTNHHHPNPNLRQCAGCGLWVSHDDHVCTVYDGPPCVTCGRPTAFYTVGAPGYGSGRVCSANHHEHLSPHGILTIEDVR